MAYSVHLSQPFLRSVRLLKRRYRRIADDLEVAIDLLQQYPELGLPIPGTSGVRKLRVASSDMARGKRGGFRLPYTIDAIHKRLILLFVYAKPEQDTLTAQEIEALLREALAGKEGI